MHRIQAERESVGAEKERGASSLERVMEFGRGEEDLEKHSDLIKHIQVEEELEIKTRAFKA